MIEVLIAERLHELGLGIYDENGTEGNIYLIDLPDETGDKDEEIISIITNGSYTREPKYNESAVKPLTSIYVRGKDLIKTSKKIDKICEGLSNDSYSTDKYNILQTFIISEPTFLQIDEKGFYTFSMRVLQNIIKK